MFASCTKTAPNLFGNIPSIYESKIYEIAKKAHELNQKNGIGAGTELILEQAPAAFEQANAEALPVADKLIGSSVEIRVDTHLGYEVVSKAKIKEVTLPDFSPSHIEPLSVKVEFDLENCNDVARLYYFLCGDSMVVHAGLMDVLPVSEGKLHVEAELKAPDVPAEYQEKIKAIRLVSSETYGYYKLDIDADQKLWRQEYNNRLNGKEAPLPLK